MTSYGIFALFFTIGVTAALNCYSGTYMEGSPPSYTQPCPVYSLFCTRTTLKVDGVNVIYYWYDCDQTQLCKSEGTFTSPTGNELYCCTGDLCNSSSKFSALLALFLIACFILY